MIHRLRVYQFEKQKGHLIIPPEEAPEISYPERKSSNFISGKSAIFEFRKKSWSFGKVLSAIRFFETQELNFLPRKNETYQSDIDDRLKNWYISIQPLLKENSV